MSEYYLSLYLFWLAAFGGVLIGLGIGLVLGRYRIKIRRAELEESDDFNHASLKPKYGVRAGWGRLGRTR